MGFMTLRAVSTCWESPMMWGDPWWKWSGARSLRTGRYVVILAIIGNIFQIKILPSHSDQTCHGRCSTKEVLLIRIPVHLCRRENTIYDVHPFNLSISTTGKNVVVEVFRSPVKEMLPSAFYASLSIPVSSLEKLKSSFSSRVEPLPFTEVYLVAGVSCRQTGRSNCWGAKKEV